MGDLCTSCGLCCTDALFEYASLDQDEVEHARAAGLDVFEGTDGPAFRLACPRLEGRCCSIYPVRPRICGAFRCALLRRVDKGKVAVDVALDRVAEVRAHVDKIAARLPEGETLREAWVRWCEMPPDGWKGDPVAGQFHLEMSVLNLLLDRHFRNSGSPVEVDKG